MNSYFLALLCVIGISTGQILFKFSAAALHRSGTFFDLRTATILGTALALYGITTIGWVWVLQRIELGKVYPLMALAFVLVPVGSYYFLSERFSAQYFGGVALIILGIVVTIRS